MELYLCRHGETEWSLSGQHTGKTDLALTKRGKEQAALLQKRLSLFSFEKVFSSPMKRALESCREMHPVIDPLLKEFDYGDYEGKTTAEIRKMRPSWHIFNEGAPNGESPELAGKRADAFLQKVGSYRGKIAIFSHGHFLRILTARYLGLAPEEAKLFCLSVASLSILGQEREQPAMLLWNDISHLS